MAQYFVRVSNVGDTRWPFLKKTSKPSLSYCAAPFGVVDGWGQREAVHCVTAVGICSGIDQSPIIITTWVSYGRFNEGRSNVEFKRTCIGMSCDHYWISEIFRLEGFPLLALSNLRSEKSFELVRSSRWKDRKWSWKPRVRVFSLGRLQISG